MLYLTTQKGSGSFLGMISFLKDGTVIGSHGSLYNKCELSFLFVPVITNRFVSHSLFGESGSECYLYSY